MNIQYTPSEWFTEGVPSTERLVRLNSAANTLNISQYVDASYMGVWCGLEQGDRSSNGSVLFFCHGLRSSPNAPFPPLAVKPLPSEGRCQESINRTARTVPSSECSLTV